MYDYRINPDSFHQYDVSCKAFLEFVAFHGVTAVFDHQRLAHKTADIGQRLGKHMSYLGGGVAVEHVGLRVS